MNAPTATPRSATTRGFTLVELLVVQGIIAVLIGFAAPRIDALTKAADAMQATDGLEDLGQRLDRFADATKRTLDRSATELGFVVGGMGPDWDPVRAEASLRRIAAALELRQVQARGLLRDLGDARARYAADAPERALIEEAARPLLETTYALAQAQRQVGLLLPAVQQ